MKVKNILLVVGITVLVFLSGTTVLSSGEHS